MNTKETKFQSL